MPAAGMGAWRYTAMMFLPQRWSAGHGGLRLAAPAVRGPPASCDRRTILWRGSGWGCITKWGFTSRGDPTPSGCRLGARRRYSSRGCGRQSIGMGTFAPRPAKKTNTSRRHRPGRASCRRNSGRSNRWVRALVRPKTRSTVCEPARLNRAGRLPAWRNSRPTRLRTRPTPTGRCMSTRPDVGWSMHEDVRAPRTATQRRFGLVGLSTLLMRFFHGVSLVRRILRPDSLDASRAACSRSAGRALGG